MMDIEQSFEQFKKKFKNFYNYVGEVSTLDDVSKYAISIQRLQLHTKKDFCNAANIMIFLATDVDFHIPEKIREDLFKEFIKITRGKLVKNGC